MFYVFVNVHSCDHKEIESKNTTVPDARSVKNNGNMICIRPEDGIQDQ